MNCARDPLLPAALAAILSSCVVLSAQQLPAPDPRFGKAAEQETSARTERIRDEIEQLGAAAGWAGSYYRGDGTGVNVYVDLAPKSGFTFTWSGCMGVYDRNHGSVAEKDGRLELTFTFPNVREGFRGLPPTLIPVAWGERRYLVAGDRMPAFANDVNGGYEPRRETHGTTLLRCGDEKQPVQGLPQLPKEFAGLLLDKPIEGLILAVRDSRVEKGEILSTRKGTAVVDRGKRHGIWLGMRLHLVDTQRWFATVTVSKVDEQTAEVLIEDLRGEQAPVPVAGWQWSTRRAWAK